MDALQGRAQVRFGRDEDLAQSPQGMLALGGPKDVGEDTGDQALAHFAEELGPAFLDAARRLAGEPSGDGFDIGLCLGRRGVDPIEGVEGAGIRIGGVQGDDPLAHYAFPIGGHHRADLARRIEDHGRRGPGQKRRNADRGGLEAARAGEHQRVCRARAARIDQQGRGSALAPGALVAGVEGNARPSQASCRPVLIDPIGLAHHDAAEGRVGAREEDAGGLHIKPVGMTVIVAGGPRHAWSRASAEPVAAQDVNAESDRQEAEHKGEGDGWI